MTSKDPAEFLPTSVQKSYFMLSRSTRAVLDTALRKYRPGRTDLIPVGGIAQLKPALRLMTAYRVVIQKVTGADVVTNYTRWLEFVQVKEGPEPEVYVAFSPRFERIWLPGFSLTRQRTIKGEFRSRPPGSFQSRFKCSATTGPPKER